MRFDSAESASDFSLPRSVTRKRLVVSNRWPISNRVAGTISCNHISWVVISAKWVASRANRMAAVIPAARPALSRGSNRIRYNATSRNTPRSTQMPQLGATKKCSESRLETAWACISTAGIAGLTGVTNTLPTEDEVGPISTILSRYFSNGILPLLTSKKESTANGDCPSLSL